MSDISLAARKWLATWASMTPRDKISFRTPGGEAHQKVLPFIRECMAAGHMTGAPRNDYPGCPMDYAITQSGHEIAKAEMQKMLVEQFGQPKS